MPKYKLEIAFKGAQFSGWQRQPGVKTIQGCLDEALAIALRLTPQQFDSVASGRTDKGVHAKTQTVSLRLEEEPSLNLEKLRYSLNALTPETLLVKSLSEVEASFDARLAAHKKCYSYSFFLGKDAPPLLADAVYPTRPDVFVESMILASRLFEGEHDFSSFRSRDCTANSTTRTVIKSEILRPSKNLLQYRVVGKGFLMHMVRIISGTLLEVGLGKLQVSDIHNIFEAKNRTLAGPTLPAKGLCLEWLKYE